MKYLLCVAGGHGGHIFDRCPVKGSQFLGYQLNVSTFVAFAAVGRRCQPGRIGLDDYMFQVDLPKNIVKPRVFKGDNSIGAQFETHINYLFGLLGRAGPAGGVGVADLRLGGLTCLLGLRGAVVLADDVAVTGYDDSTICALCEPELTSVDGGKERMGEEAVRLLCELIAKKTEIDSVVLDAKLRVRASSAEAVN